MNEFELTLPDQKRIWVYEWIPEKPVKGIVQIVHGISEHMGRYERFARFLNEKGYAVIGDDHLGHGKSVDTPENLGWVDHENGWKQLVESEKTVFEYIQNRYPATPVVLFGHSMGSFIARTVLGWYPELYDSCVLSGTGHQPVLVCKAGRFIANRHIRRYGSREHSRLLDKLSFGSYLKRIDHPKSVSDWLSRDEKIVSSYQKDPLSGYKASASLMRDMLEGLETIAGQDHIRKMNPHLPVLFVAGEEDPVGNYGSGVVHVKNLFQKNGMKKIELILYPGMRHEVLNEIGYEKVHHDLLDWIEKSLAGKVKRDPD